MSLQPLVVWKFGGTSVAEPAPSRAVDERMVAAHRTSRPVVTVRSEAADIEPVLEHVARPVP
jgi:aspartokinase